MRSRLSWLLVAGAVPAALLGASAGLGLARRLSAVLNDPRYDLLVAVGPLLGSALALLALTALLVLLNVDARPAAPSRGDLDRLAGAKRRLAGVPRSYRVRASAARARRGAPAAAGQATGGPAAPVPPGDVLEALLRRKQRWPGSARGGPRLAIRFGVILRKVWGGSRTGAGARAQAVLL
jgi:hypothetical protein